jgi:hypothetical protein
MKGATEPKKNQLRTDAGEVSQVADVGYGAQIGLADFHAVSLV